MFRYWLNMYRKHKDPSMYCGIPDCFTELTIMRIIADLNICADCQIDMMIDELEYEIYEYLGGESYGFN